MFVHFSGLVDIKTDVRRLLTSLDTMFVINIYDSGWN